LTDWPEKISNIEQNIDEVAHSAIERILYLNPISTRIKDAGNAVRVLEWFEKADLRNHNTLSPILSYHLEVLLKQFIQRPYIEENDAMVAVYLRALVTALIPSMSFHGMPALTLQDTIHFFKEHDEQMKKLRELDDHDKGFAEDIQTNSVQLMHLC